MFVFLAQLKRHQTMRFTEL